MGRQEEKSHLDGARESYSADVDELGPVLVTVVDVQYVLQILLREGLPIRNLVTFLESLADMAPVSRDVDYFTEFVREALGRQICQKYQEDSVLTELT